MQEQEMEALVRQVRAETLALLVQELERMARERPVRALLVPPPGTVTPMPPT
jgi:hypothetical protein